MQGNESEDFTPGDVIKHLQLRDSAMHDQIAAVKESVGTAEDQLRDQIRSLKLEQQRNRAWIIVNEQFAKIGVAATYLSVDRGQHLDLKAEIAGLFGSINSAHSEITAADSAEEINPIVISLAEKVGDFLGRVREAL